MDKTVSAFMVNARALVCMYVRSLVRACLYSVCATISAVSVSMLVCDVFKDTVYMLIQHTTLTV